MAVPLYFQRHATVEGGEGVSAITCRKINEKCPKFNAKYMYRNPDQLSLYKRISAKAINGASLVSQIHNSFQTTDISKVNFLVPENLL